MLTRFAENHSHTTFYVCKKLKLIVNLVMWVMSCGSGRAGLIIQVPRLKPPNVAAVAMETDSTTIWTPNSVQITERVRSLPLEWGAFSAEK